MEKSFSIVADRSVPDYLSRVLIAQRGTYVSGEVISREAGVTRAAIWKQINQLKSLGYVIDSAPRMGYRLVASPDMLLPEEIWARCDLTIIGQRIHYYSRIDSTNILAKKLAQEGEPHGTLVIAEEQDLGKGRLGRHWSSPKGGLWLSIILRPLWLPQDAPKLTLLTAVAVTEALKTLGITDVSIKWPNDIILKGKKTCGILTELSAEMDAINHVVIGIGLNVNNSDFPEQFQEGATSLHKAMRVTFDRLQVLAELLKSFEKNYSMAEDQGFGEILDKWRTLCGNLRRGVKVIGRTHSFEGIALDIDDTGALLVQRDDGRVERVLSGDVSLRAME